MPEHFPWKFLFFLNDRLYLLCLISLIVRKVQHPRVKSIGEQLGLKMMQFVNFGGAVHCFAEPDEHGSVPGCQFHEPSYRRSMKMMHGFFDEAFARRN